MKDFEQIIFGKCRLQEGDGTCAIINQYSEKFPKPQCPNPTRTIDNCPNSTSCKLPNVQVTNTLSPVGVIIFPTHHTLL